MSQLQAAERRHLDALYWGGVLIWSGLAFGADSMGYLPQIGEADAWTWVFFGAGLYALVGALWRVAAPNVSNPTAWDYIWAGVLLIIGIDGIVGIVDLAFPLILLFVGIIWLGSTLLDLG
jgi:hypothetical protein